MWLPVSIYSWSRHWAYQLQEKWIKLYRKQGITLFAVKFLFIVFDIYGPDDGESNEPKLTAILHS